MKTLLRSGLFLAITATIAFAQDATLEKWASQRAPLALSAISKRGMEKCITEVTVLRDYNGSFALAEDAAVLTHLSTHGLRAQLSGKVVGDSALARSGYAGRRQWHPAVSCDPFGCHWRRQASACLASATRGKTFHCRNGCKPWSNPRWNDEGSTKTVCHCWAPGVIRPRIRPMACGHN
jgi:hypothetical protein